MVGFVTSASGTEYAWGYAFDEDHLHVEGEPALVVAILDPDTDEVLNTMGGVTGDFEVSDHGNVNASADLEAHMAALAADLADEVRSF
mgnify:CR=1 FL=1